MSWFILILAGLFEIAWATGLKFSDGFTILGPSIFTIVTMAISVYLLAVAVKKLPLGTAYAVWTGIGAIGTVVLGIIVFSEPATAMRLFFVGCILVGIIGLKVTSTEKKEAERKG